MSHLKKAEEMMMEKRPPQDVFCQFRAAEGDLHKIIYLLLTDALRRELTANINRLLEHDSLTAEQAETLISIRKKTDAKDVKKLFRLISEVDKIEKDLTHT
jgi:hypothetical protein